MANITRYDPFGDLVDDIFRGFVVGPVGFEAASPVRRMKVDVAEQNGEYKVVAELPGVKKEDAFRLSQEIDEARASAKYADGVLELTLPKKATAAAKQLTIQ